MLATITTTISIQLLSADNGRALHTWIIDGTHAPISIGRCSSGHIAIDSIVVSRRHACLEKVNRQWQLRNLGKNGCYVNGNRVDCYPISGKAHIRLGRTGPCLCIEISTSDNRPRSMRAATPAPAKKKKRNIYIGRATQEFLERKGLVETSERTFTIDPTRSRPN